MHLDNVEGKDKDDVEGKDLRGGLACHGQSPFTDKIGYCNICNTRYHNRKKHIESEQHNKNDKEKKLGDGKWREKVNELGLDHNMKQNQIIIFSSNYEDPRFLEALEALQNIHPHIKFNTFDVVRYTKTTDDRLKENEFTFTLMTRQYNGPFELDMLNGGLETRM